MKLALLLFLLASCGCTRVRAYQDQATRKCLEHHSPAQCRPLPHPACEPGEFGGVKCQGNER